MIYLDANATTPLLPSARQSMLHAMECWGNPSSAHQRGRSALELLEKSRNQVASKVLCDPEELVFTSGGSEANTSVLVGKARAIGSGFRVLVSPVEHASIRDLVETLGQIGSGYGVLSETIELDANGGIPLGPLKTQLARFRPHLVSVMLANNETGILYPIREIVEASREVGAEVHTDAVQAFGKLSPAHWQTADYVSLSAHKIGGPAGVGALRVSKGRKIVPTHFGGSQELKRRGGTPNVIGIAGFAGALADLATSSMVSSMVSPNVGNNLSEDNLADATLADDTFASVGRQRDFLEERLRSSLSGISIQGGMCPRVPNTSNIRIEGVPADRMMTALDLDGICISTGSACSSGSIKPSPVLLAMGLTAQSARECIRISLGRDSTLENIETALERIIFHANRIRSRKERA